MLISSSGESISALPSESDANSGLIIWRSAIDAASNLARVLISIKRSPYLLSLSTASFITLFSSIRLLVFNLLGNGYSLIFLARRILVLTTISLCSPAPIYHLLIISTLLHSVNFVTKLSRFFKLLIFFILSP